MAVHHFDKSLEKEKEAGRHADLFYKRAPFAVQSINRYNQDTPAHLVLQRQDIDLNISFDDGRTYAVSEKFRKRDYNDLLLEIYSKYPHTKGWVHKSKAYRLAYFLPKRMFWIDKTMLTTFCIHTLFPRIEGDAIERLLTDEQNSLKVGVKLEGTLYNCTLTQAFNNTDGDMWNTISISVPFKMLADFEIRFQVFKR